MTPRAKRLLVVLIFVSLLTGIFFSGRVLAFFRSQTVKLVPFSGQFVSYDVEKRQMVVSTGKKGSNPITFAVAPDVKLMIDGKDGGSIMSIAKDTRVALKLNSEKTTIIELSASGSSVRRYVSEIDVVKRTATILVDTVYETKPIAEDAKLLISGKSAPLDQLPTKVQSTVRVSVDGKTIIYMNTPRPPKKSTVPKDTKGPLNPVTSSKKP